MLKKLIILFILPLYLFCQNVEKEPVKLIKKEDTSTTVEATNLTINDNTDIENQIALQNKMLEEIVANINNESFLTTFPNSSEYDDEIDFLINRINANKRFNNDLAVKRDEIKILYLSEKKEYENTLKSIIIAKQEYKDKKYFKKLLKDNIELINSGNITQYEALYENERKNNNKVSSEFINNYIDLFNQSNTQLFVLNYLLENMAKFRPLNFLIDEFNLQYFVDKIDGIKGISFISKLTSYYMKFSIGEIAVVLFILIFFRLINKYSTFAHKT